MTTDLTFITNESGKNLKDRFGALIKDTQFFDVLVGYFYTSGFYAIYPQLEKTKNIQGDIAAQVLAQRKANDPFFNLSENEKRNQQIIDKMKRDPDIAQWGLDLKTGFELFKLAVTGLATGNLSAPGDVGTAFGEAKNDQRLMDIGNKALSSPGARDDIAAITELSGQQGGVSPQIANLIDKLQKGVSESARAFDKGFQKRQQDRKETNL